MNKSYWLATSKAPRFPQLKQNITVDVAVIGAGITGITTAYLLKKAGYTVALIERDRCFQADTGHTTAHLTCVTDTRLHELIQTFGKDHARAVWDAGLAAVDQIDAITQKEKIDCQFRRIPGYLHSPPHQPPSDDRDTLKQDAHLAAELGFDAHFLDAVPLFNTPGMRIANQAKFHPLHYLAALVQTITGKGSHVFENTEAEEFIDKPLGFKANGHTVGCQHLVIATHVPLTANTNLVSATLFQTKLYPYSSYAIGAKLPQKSAPEASFWDTGDPYNYLRIDAHKDHEYAILGGKDHKTGQVDDPESRYQALEKDMLSLFPQAKIDHRWTGQVIETNDGLPFIGEMAPHQFIATGFAGNGMTFGTLSAMMAHDYIVGRNNPWKDLFDPHRKKILGGTWDYIKENIDYPYYLLKDRLTAPEGESLRSLKTNQGKILKIKGEKVAAYRDAKGKVTLVSPVCTHLGCIVHFNDTEQTWDCPCHGSRFKITGEVFAGPAETPLEEKKPK